MDKRIQMRSEQYHYKICLDKILEFIHQIKYDNNIENQMNHTFTTKDYQLVHFQKYICKKISDLDLNNQKWQRKKR